MDPDTPIMDRHPDVEMLKYIEGLLTPEETTAIEAPGMDYDS